MRRGEERSPDTFARNIAAADSATISNVIKHPARCRDKLARIIELVLSIVSKHTSTEKFKFQLSNSLHVSSTDHKDLVIELQGNATSREEALPLSLEWETTFLDIVNDFKAVILEFRRGGEDDDDGGVLARDSGFEKAAKRRSSIARLFGW